MQQVETINRKGLVSEHAAIGVTASAVLVAAAADKKIYVTNLLAFTDVHTANGLTLRSGAVTISYIGFSSVSVLEQNKSFSGAAGEPILVTSVGSALYGAASVANIQVSVTYYYD